MISVKNPVPGKGDAFFVQTDSNTQRYDKNKDKYEVCKYNSAFEVFEPYPEYVNLPYDRSLHFYREGIRSTKVSTAA